MGSTTEITASPKLRSMFAVASFIMLALWAGASSRQSRTGAILTKMDFLTSPSSTRRSSAYLLEFTCLLAQLPATDDMLGAPTSCFLSLPE